MPVQLIRWVRDSQPKRHVSVKKSAGIVHAWALDVGGGRKIIDSAGSASGVFGTGDGGTTGNSFITKKNTRVLLFDNTGTGTIESTNLLVGNSSGSGGPLSNVFSIVFTVSCADFAVYNGIYGSTGTGVSIDVNTSGLIRFLKESTSLICTSNSRLYENVPVRICITYDGTNAKMYFNGVYDAGASNAQSFSTSVQYSLGWCKSSSEYLRNGSTLGAFYVYNKVLSAAEVLEDYKNPWQIFEPETIPLFYSTVTAQYARPTSDVSTGTWTASTGSDLFAMLDETTASDADYIVTTGASTCEVALAGLNDPAVSTGHIVRYRISSTTGGITVRLRQGTTTIASWTHNPAPTSLTTYSQTLSAGEADSITNYGALKLQFEAI